MTSVSVKVEGMDQVGEARRRATAMAAGLGFGETDAGRTAVVVSECASNLVKHAGGGEILLSPLDGGGPAGLEILALDKGPGMRNPALCFQDGYSTAGSPGTGLGAVRRLSSECNVYTEVEKGTALVARLRTGGTGNEEAWPTHTGGVCVPKPGEEVCGDGWAVREGAGFIAAMVVDGLGHGPSAADCARAAEEAFGEAYGRAPVEIVKAIHGALRAMRGAALAVLRLDCASREIRFAGIGNIAGAVYSGGNSRQMISHPGIVGHDIRRVREATYEWPPGALTLVYSDGIATHWSMDAYEGLGSMDVSLIAGVIYRDWRRGRDDATVLALREGGMR
ncbi:MAG: SpoIIE family protein phosphatase [Acidobacteriia bacterium]|nr:SpoIIE family protein phosphatase [Terriglobia bacterium]